MGIIVPAILPSSRADLKGKLSLFVGIPSVERIQIDVVDGIFATPACWPYTAPEEFRAMLEQEETLPHPERIAYEIDLMCADAELAVQDWLTLGASRLTFHAESVSELPRLLAFVRERYGSGGGFATGLISFGVALNLETDLALIEPVLQEVEYVQFMGIAQIGRQGQPLDDRVFDKLRIFHTRHPNIAMQVDGGVTLQNAKKLLSIGVSQLVVGSALSRAESPKATLAAFEDLKPSFGV
jgi:ribulose-phosphate 3-epimerase